MGKMPRTLLNRAAAATFAAELDPTVFERGVVLEKSRGNLPHDPKTMHADPHAFFMHLELK